MTAGELKQLIIDLIEDGTITEDSEVVLATQPRYPLEATLDGAVVRKAVLTEDAMQQAEEDGEKDVKLTDELLAESLERGQGLNDLILCEGSQLGYGSKSCWDTASVTA